jgi:hypothetical protein
LKWERTDEYDSVIKIIGKNRKLLNDSFRHSANSEEGKKFNIGLQEP